MQTQRILGSLALGTLLAFGCAPTAEEVNDPQSSDPAFMEDLGTPEQDQALPEIPSDAKEDFFGTLTTACGVVDAIQGISDTKATEWRVDPSGRTVYSSSTYSLFDTYNSRYVKYGERTYGINLVWSSTAPSNIRLERSGGGFVRYGDRVAIHVNDGGYVKYGSRTWGINLVWSSSPVYEWEVRGGTVGTVVPTGTKVRLFNAAENDNLVYCARPVGINLAWAKDCTDIPGLGRYRTGYCP
jgi:hypothetical protein